MFSIFALYLSRHIIYFNILLTLNIFGKSVSVVNELSLKSKTTMDAKFLKAESSIFVILLCANKRIFTDNLGNTGTYVIKFILKETVVTLVCLSNGSMIEILRLLQSSIFALHSHNEQISFSFVVDDVMIANESKKHQINSNISHAFSKTVQIN